MKRLKKTRNLSSFIEIGDSTSHIYGVVLWCSTLITSMNVR